MKNFLPILLLLFNSHVLAGQDLTQPSGAQGSWIGWFKVEGGYGLVDLSAFHNDTQNFVQNQLSQGWSTASASMGSEVWTGMLEAGVFFPASRIWV